MRTHGGRHTLVRATRQHTGERDRPQDYFHGHEDKPAVGQPFGLLVRHPEKDDSYVSWNLENTVSLSKEL